MIVELLLNIVYYLVKAILFLLTLVFSAFPDMQPYLDQFHANIVVLGLMDQFFPVISFLILVAFFLAVESYLFFYKLIKWSYKKIPGVN